MMARPLKDGVDYFPKDTDFYGDDKVKLLRAEFGAKGMYILDYLLCDLYGKNGYFLTWGDDRCFLVSDGAGCACSPEFIAEFVRGCVARSFFDERVFNVFGVLTSAGIQRRYIRMFNSRDDIVIFSEYWLLDVNDKKDVPPSVLGKIAFKNLKSTENPVKSTENPVKSTENPLNKSKVKDTNVSQSKTTAFAAVFEGLIAEYPDDTKALLRDWLEVRKKKRAPETERSITLNLDKLDGLAKDSGLTVNAYLEEVIRRGWQGFFPIPRYGGIKPEKSRPKPSYDTSKMTESVNIKWAEYVKEDRQ